MRKLKVGIAGQRGLSYLLGFQQDPRTEVVAFCDINEDVLLEQANKHHIPKTYRIYEDMLASDIDIAVVATPMQLHFQHTLAALLAGKHVFCEVTAASTMEELFWLAEAVEKSGKVYMMTENYLYIPQVQQILAMARAGLFGRLYFGEGEYIHNLESVAGTGGYWRHYWQLGRRGLFYPTHSLGPVMKWMDDHVTAVSCFGTGSHTNPSFLQDDTSLTLCHTQNDALVKIRLDCLSQRPHNLSFYSLQGTKGCYEAPRCTGDSHKIYLTGSDGYADDAEFEKLDQYQSFMPERYQNATDEQKNTGHWGGDYFIVSDYIDSITKGTKPPVDVYDACEWTAVGLLSEKSIRNNGRTYDVPVFKNEKQTNFIYC